VTTTTGTLAAWWNQAASAAHLTDADRRRAAATGIQAADALLAHSPRNDDAMLLKALLLRVLAALEGDAAVQASLLADAALLHRAAEGIRKRKTAGLA